MIKKDKDFNKEQLALGALIGNKYDCPKCGVVDQVINVTIEGHDVEGDYCLVCLAKWYKKNLPLLTKRGE